MKQHNNHKKETIMNFRTTLCLTVCSVALMSGCGDTLKSGSNTPTGEQPSQSAEPSNLTELLISEPSVQPQGQPEQKPLKSAVYIYNSLIQKPETPIELTDSAYFMTLDSYLHWVENQKIINIPGSTPHSINTTQKLKKVPDSDSSSGVIMDAWGYSAKNKGQFELSGDATFSCLDLRDSDLRIRGSGNLTALALRFENAQVSISQTGKITTHALYVDKDSVITNGNNIRYVPDELSHFGMTMQQLNANKHKRFPWATEGEFMVEGRVDHLILTPGVKLYTQGRAARIDLVDQQGGFIELTSSAPFNVSTYMASQAGGTLNVVWDTPSTTPLMQVEYTEIKSPVSVTLSELNGSIKIGDKIVLIESKRSKLTGFIQGRQTFAASFDLTNSADETIQANRLTMTLTGKGLKATGLSHTETQIARQILSQDDVKGTLRTALLDTTTAKKALHDITQGSHLSAIRSIPLTFDGLHEGDQYRAETGVFHGVYQTGLETQNTVGLNPTPNARLSVSVTQPTIGMPQSNIGAMHGQYKQMGIDGFSSVDGTLNGASLGACHGNMSDGYAALNISTLRHARHGSSNTVFGQLDVNTANETHVFCTATLKKRTANIDVSAQIFTEIYAARSSYRATLNNANLSIPAEILPLTYGVQFQTAFTYDCGRLTTGGGLTKDISLGYSPSFNLSFDMEM